MRASTVPQALQSVTKTNNKEKALRLEGFFYGLKLTGGVWLPVSTLVIDWWGRYRPDLVQYSFRWKEYLRSRWDPTQRAIVHRTIAFDGSNLTSTILQNKKDIRKDVLFVLLLVYTLDITFRNRYRPDLVQYSFRWKEYLRSRWDPTQRAIVHRTIAFDGSNLTFTILQNKKDIRKDALFVLLLVYTLDITFRNRYRPDLLAFSFP